MELQYDIFPCDGRDSENSEDFKNKIMHVLDLFGLYSSIKALQDLGLLRGLANLSQDDLKRLQEIHKSGLVINLRNILPLSSINLNEDEINTLRDFQKRGIEVKTREDLLNMLTLYKYHHGKITGNSYCDLLLCEDNKVGKISEKQLKNFLSKLFFEYKTYNLQSFSIGIDGSNWLLSIKISKTSISISLCNDKIIRIFGKYNGRWINKLKYLIINEGETIRNKNKKSKNSNAKLDYPENNDELYKLVVNNNLLKVLEGFFYLCSSNRYSVFLFNVIDKESGYYKNFDDLLNKVKKDFGENIGGSQIFIEDDSITLLGNDSDIVVYKRGGGFSIKRRYKFDDGKNEWVSLDEFFDEVNKLKMKVGKI